VNTREAERARLAGEIAKLTRHRSVREVLRPLRQDGVAPFVVAFPEDTLGEIDHRARTVGGRAHVVVVDQLKGSTALRLRILRLDPSSKPIAELDEQKDCVVDDKSTVGMLLEHMEVGGALTYHTYDSDTVIRFLTDSVQPVPA
jgi:hypothetical protein